MIIEYQRQQLTTTDTCCYCGQLLIKGQNIVVVDESRKYNEACYIAKLQAGEKRY